MEKGRPETSWRPQFIRATHLKGWKRFFCEATVLCATTTGKSSHFLCILSPRPTRDGQLVCVKLPSLRSWPQPHTPTNRAMARQQLFSTEVQGQYSRTPLAWPLHVPNSSHFLAANEKAKSLLFWMKDESVYSAVMLHDSGILHGLISFRNSIC